jgi:hypothetical protein
MTNVIIIYLFEFYVVNVTSFLSSMSLAVDSVAQYTVCRIQYEVHCKRPLITCEWLMVVRAVQGIQSVAGLCGAV